MTAVRAVNGRTSVGNQYVMLARPRLRSDARIPLFSEAGCVLHKESMHVLPNQGCLQFGAHGQHQKRFWSPPLMCVSDPETAALAKLARHSVWVGRVL